MCSHVFQISAGVDQTLSSQCHFREALNSLPNIAPWSKTLIEVKGDKLDSNNEPLTRVAELWLRNPMDVVRGLLARHDL